MRASVIGILLSYSGEILNGSLKVAGSDICIANIHLYTDIVRIVPENLAKLAEAGSGVSGLDQGIAVIVPHRHVRGIEWNGVPVSVARFLKEALPFVSRCQCLPHRGVGGQLPGGSRQLAGGFCIMSGFVVSRTEPKQKFAIVRSERHSFL